MSGIQTKCVDNPRLRITGCGAKYSGELQHSVARVDWSTHNDGRAHITGTSALINRLWGKSQTMRNPAELGLTQDERGRWYDPVLREKLAERLDRRSATVGRDATLPFGEAA